MDRAERTRTANGPHYASFTLRCWRGPNRRVRARLIDVASGDAYPLADLAGLPELLQRLLANAEQVDASGAPDGSVDDLQEEQP